MVKGQERLLIRNGQLQEDEMKKAHITEHDLQEALRISGKAPDVAQVESAHLERNGDISIVSKKD
jgi:uncharacterized membrane protein YcaP (DUF421 family)